MIALALYSFVVVSFKSFKFFMCSEYSVCVKYVYSSA